VFEVVGGVVPDQLAAADHSELVDFPVHVASAWATAASSASKPTAVSADSQAL
jgi:hypothetical protein